MTLKIIDSEQLEEVVRVLAYGAENAGKSHLGHSAPDPIVIDFEQRSNAFRQQFKFKTIQPKRFSEGLEAVKMIAAAPNGFQTIVIDSLTKPYNAVIRRFTTVKKTDGGGEYSSTDWPAVNRTMLEFNEPVLAIPGKNVVCIARQGVKLERSGRDFKRSGVKMVADENRIRYDYDYVLHYAMRGSATVEKSMSDHLPVGAEIRGDLDWDRLMRLIRGEEKLDARVHPVAQRQPAPVVAPAPVQKKAPDPGPAGDINAQDHGSHGEPTLIDQLLANLPIGDTRKIHAFAKSRKVDESGLVRMIARVEQADGAPLLPDHVEALMDELKAVEVAA